MNCLENDPSEEQNSRDYYETLGCDPNSSEEQIMAEYRVKARLHHPDKEGNTEEFQEIQEAKETLLDQAKRSLYDKWRGSGLNVPFKQWESMKESMSATLHWAVPKQERMLPEGQENKPPGNSPTIEKMNTLAAEKKLVRQDSTHPTLIIVNKWSEDDIRKKFRNYEI